MKAAHAAVALTAIGSLLLTAAAPTEIPWEGQGPSGLVTGISVGDTLRGLSTLRLDAALAEIRGLGVTAVRIDMPWSAAQPHGPDSFEWAELDAVVEGARAHRLGVLAILAYTPSWARPSGCRSDKCLPADVEQFADFAAAAADRYSGRGVRAWEIWNEPNIEKFWKPAPDADAYVSLLSPAATAIRDVDPAAIVLSGGLASVGPAAEGIPAADFLDRMLQVGAARHLDGVAYHPYTYPFPASYQCRCGFATSWNAIGDSGTSLLGVMAAHGVSKPVWITEYGAPTGGHGKSNDGQLIAVAPATDHVTERWQASIATDAVWTASTTRGVTALMWYSLRDLDTDSTAEGFYGVFRSDGSAKPAAASLRSALRALAVGNGRPAGTVGD